jgi:hypothetical protein
MRIANRFRRPDKSNPDALVARVVQEAQNLYVRIELHKKAVDEAYQQYRKLLEQVQPGMSLPVLNAIYKRALEIESNAMTLLEQGQLKLNDLSAEVFELVQPERLGLFPAHDGERPDRRADVVFVHGLDGNAYTTWCYNRTKLFNSWPFWLADEFGEAGVWLLSYPAASSHWSTGALEGLSDLASITKWTVGKLRDKVGQRPLIFVTHSLGGLLVKAVVQWASANPTGWGEALTDSVRGVTFLATPHRGADLAALANRFKKLYRTMPIVDTLLRNQQIMSDLQQSFRSFAARHPDRIRITAYYETRPTGWGMFRSLVVDRDSADPEVKGAEVKAAEATDHRSICKCAEKRGDVYDDVRRMIEIALRSP